MRPLQYWLLLFLAIIQGCAIRSVYLPVSQNVALFDSAREVQASAFLSANHIELQAAANPTRRLALTTNIDFGNGITVYDAAIGLHGFSQTTKWRWELYSGFGYNVNSLYPGSNDASVFTRNGGDYRVSALYQKYYLQPAIGYCGAMEAYQLQYFFALSARASVLHFNDYTFREIDQGQTTDPDHPVYRVNRHYTGQLLYLLEPCITNKVSRGHWTGILQVQGMIPYSKVIDVRNTRFSPGFIFSSGIGYHLSIKKKQYTWK